MSKNYKSTLQSNNTDLQSLLDAFNALPEAEGIDTSDATATAAEIYAGATAYVDGEKITGTMPAVPRATPIIMVDEDGLITATVDQQAGRIMASGTKTTTKQLAFAPAKTITPSATSQVAVSSGYYTGGDITVAGDSNLTADNIKNGVSIFGVNGTYEGEGGSGEVDHSVEDELVARTISVYTNDRVTNIGSSAFN